MKSTNLEFTSINGFKLGNGINSLTIQDLQNCFGEFTDDTGMPITLYSDHDESLRFHQWYFGVFKNEISTIVTESNYAQTEKGIKVGDFKNKIIQEYGENYFIIYEEIGETIGYIDRKNKFILQFVIYEDRINQIILKYK